MKILFRLYMGNMYGKCGAVADQSIITIHIVIESALSAIAYSYNSSIDWLFNDHTIYYYLFDIKNWYFIHIHSHKFTFTIRKDPKSYSKSICKVKREKKLM